MITKTNFKSEFKKHVDDKNFPEKLKSAGNDYINLTENETLTDEDIIKYDLDKIFAALQKWIEKNTASVKKTNWTPKYKDGQRVIYTDTAGHKKEAGRIVHFDEANPHTYLFKGDTWDDADNVSENRLIEEPVKQIVQPPAAQKPAKTPKTRKTPKAKPTKSEKPTYQGKMVELVSTEVKFIKRYVAMHNKVKSQQDILNFINVLQKAILEKRIRKTSPYAEEIKLIQDRLIEAYDKMGDTIQISIAPDRLSTFMDYANSEKVMLSIVYIKQFIGLHGKEGIKEKAQNLLNRINKAIKSKKIADNDPYTEMLKDVLIHLNEVSTGKAKRLSVEPTELNGMKAACLSGFKDNLKIFAKKTYEKGKKFTKQTINRTKDEIAWKKHKFVYDYLKKYASDGTNLATGEKLSKQQKDIIREARYFLGKNGFIEPKHLSGINSVGIKSDELGFLPGLMTNMLANALYEKMPGVKKTIENIKPAVVDNEKINSMDLQNMKFESIGLKGKYGQLIGDPVEPWAMMIYGGPGSGKSTFAIDFARTLAADLNKKIAFVPKEEGVRATLKDKFTRLNAIHSNIDLFPNKLPKNLDDYKYLFIDSVNEMGLNVDALSNLMEKHPKVSFVFVFKGTKTGGFRGSEEFENLVDVSIGIDEGTAAVQKSRFGGKGNMTVYATEEVPAQQQA